MKSSKTIYTALYHAYSYFNQGLFEGELPDAVITLGRARYARGMAIKHLWKEEDTNSEKYYHELVISPHGLTQSLIDVYSTLVHEQCHIWQFEYGNPGKRGYHNWEWAKKMDSIGLTPSKTAKEGGDKTGRPMSHFITPNGKYENLFKKMPKRCALPAISMEGYYRPSRKRNKIKYTCLPCHYSVWGRSNLKIICGNCNNSLTNDPDINLRYW